MNRYRFGYTFARLSTPLATILFLLGLGGAAIKYAQGSMQAAALRYHPGGPFALSFQNLEREATRLQFLMRDRFNRVPVPLAGLPGGFPPRNTADFAPLEAWLARTVQERDETKDSLLGRFEQSILAIEGKLQAHAAALREPATAPPPAPTPPAAPERNAETVFSHLESRELVSRRESLAESRAFIERIKGSAESQENIAILSTALEELDALNRLLPTSLEAAPANPEANSAPRTTRPLLQAELIARQLSQVRALVQAALLTDWSIDRALEKAAAELESEKKACADSEQRLRQLWLTTGTWMGVLIIGMTILAFLTLVLADLVSSLLDAAKNSAILVAIQRSPGTPEYPDL